MDAAYRWVVEETGTYTEVSPSGDGLHLIFRGAKPDWAQRTRKGQPGGRVVEMYDHDRYFTVTGDVFEGRGALGSNPEVVERAYRTWIEPEARSAQPRLDDAVREASPGDMGDDELVERMLASRSGGDIRALLAGDCSAQGGDHSAADMALCSHLAFWCAGDAARMDRIFRASGLMRDKWDSRRGSTTYGAQTIERAISGATEFYKPKAARRNGSSRSRANNKNVCSMSTRREQQGVPDDDAPREATTEDAPSIEGWYVDERGRLWAADAAGELRYTVTATAPWIACDLVDVDTGDVRALVRVSVAGGVRERALDRGVLLNQTRIIGALAPLGANVSSTNAKDIVRYLTDCERRCAGTRPRARSVVHLGWAEGALSSFIALRRGRRGALRPLARRGGEGAAVHGARGDAPGLGWRAWRPRGRRRPRSRCVMAASFASSLVALLGVQTFIVYLWGRSRSGKTPTLKAAGSVWGDPTEGSDSYFRTFADTPKSIVRAAALFHDIPVIIDELQSKGAPGGQASKRQIVEDLLYSLSLGHERGALNSDRSMMRAGSWRSLTIATGEIPIVGESTQQGSRKPNARAQRRALLRREGPRRGCTTWSPLSTARRDAPSSRRCGATPPSSTPGSSRRCATRSPRSRAGTRRRTTSRCSPSRTRSRSSTCSRRGSRLAGLPGRLARDGGVGARQRDGLRGRRHRPQGHPVRGRVARRQPHPLRRLLRL